MKFSIDGKPYDTRAMRRFDLGGHMVVYVNEQERCAFVQTIDRQRGVVLNRASSQQLAFLSRTYNQPDLLRYMPLAEC